MCGIVGYVGSFEKGLINKVVYESTVRGLHYLGFATNGRAGIYHARYITSGETNQPLIYQHRYLAFNGVVNMGTKEEMEAEYNFKMETDNDGEIILRMCPTSESVVEFLKSSKATFAGIFLEEHKLTAIRNTGRPMWIHNSENGILIASTNDIFKRSGIAGAVEAEPYKIYEWTF